METGYEVDPERVAGGTDRRRPLAVAVVALAIVAIVIAKPWSVPATPATSVVSPAVVPLPTPASVVAIIPETATVPAWPAEATPTKAATDSARQAEIAVGWLARRSGEWGIGVAGIGPRVLRDEPWSAWTAVTAEIVDGAPAHIATWPGTDVCAGYPAIYDGPTVVAITTPRDVAPDRVLRGWWTDGATVASLDGSVVQVSPPGNRGIGYLERRDKAPWPPGRYEFHVVVGATSVSMTVCLTRQG